MTTEADWRSQWIEHTRKIPHDVPYQRSAQYLQDLIKTGLLRYTDAQTNPDRFFEAHRLLVGLESPGFSIRFTVQYNLFAGTIIGLGSPEQIKILEDFQKKGTLGCFALTEKLAGVNSGLVVKTTATYDEKRNGFVVNCADQGAYKNWISQGLTASKAALIADLRIEGKSLGPHGFLIDLREDGSGKVLPGITLVDMGLKSTANDLDNASIQFSNVFIPSSSLLSRFCKIENGKYVQLTKEKMRIEIIGQRLLTGRIAIAQAALEFCSKLYERTKEYTNQKKCWSPGAEPVLGSIAHIAALYKEADQTLTLLKDFTLKVERALSKTFTSGGIPTPEIVEAVAVAKIAAVENAISLSFRLKQEVGSYALMGGSGFEHLDFLTCCKFAEGDSKPCTLDDEHEIELTRNSLLIGRILMQKLARDQVRSLSRFKSLDDIPPSMKKEAKIAMSLVQAGKDKWDENFRLVYALSDAIQARIMLEWTGKNLQQSML